MNQLILTDLISIEFYRIVLRIDIFLRHFQKIDFDNHCSMCTYTIIEFILNLQTTKETNCSIEKKIGAIQMNYPNILYDSL